MNKLEIVERAINASAFDTNEASADYINPEYWNRRVLDHVRANIVITQFAADYSDLLGDGDVLNKTVRQEPSAAAAIAESVDVPTTAWAVSTVAYTPSEYAKSYQLTDKERKRAFFSVMESMSSDIGYALALAKDALCNTRILAGAGNTVVANGVASSLLASTDTMDHLDVLDAMEENEVDKFNGHLALFIHPRQKRALMADTQFLSADKFGSNTVPMNGVLGQVFGIPVMSTTQITITSSTAKAILVSDPEAYGIVDKTFEGIKMQRQELGRYTDIVGVGDFDVQVNRANALCTIETWAA